MATESNAELEQMLNELKSDSAKRRWATIQRLAKMGVEDDRFIDALKIMAAQDPQVYVRDEALATLKQPVYQDLVRRRNEAMERAAAEQAEKNAQPVILAPRVPKPPTVTPPPPPRAPISPTPINQSPEVLQPTAPSIPTNVDAPSQTSELAHCTNCGFANPKGMKFCQNCGKPLAIQCPNCGTQNAGGVKFCGNCGTLLAQKEASPSTTQEQPAVDTTSPALREAQNHRGDDSDPKRMTIFYQLKTIETLEDCFKVLNLLEYDQDNKATNYENLIWTTDSSNVPVVRYGNKSVTLKTDIREGMDLTIQTLNPNGLLFFFNDPMKEAVAVLKEWHTVSISNISLKRLPKANSNADMCMVWAPLKFSPQWISKDREPAVEFVHWVTAGLLASSLGANDATILIENCVQTGMKFDIDLVPEGQPEPKKIKCHNCGYQLLEVLSECFVCGEYPKSLTAQPLPERWEYCEIVWTGKKSGARGIFNVATQVAFTGSLSAPDSHIQFWVKASSPRGNYNAGESEWMSTGDGTPDQRNRHHAEAFDKLITKLLQDGWEPVRQGETWYNMHLRRRFRA